MERSPRLRKLGQRIVTLREKRKWSQAELAQRIAVPRSRLSKWEPAARVIFYLFRPIDRSPSSLKTPGIHKGGNPHA